MHCLIIDDDNLICELLTHFCSKTPSIRSIAKANSGFEAIHLIGQSDYDLIFLDFNLPDLTGKQLASLIKPASAIVMVTSHTEFAAESYNYSNIVDFLVKPIDFQRFEKAIVNVEDYHSRSRTGPSDIFLRDGNKLVKVRWDDVLFFKSEANYISVVLKDKKILTLMTMKDLEAKIPANFQRIHRSFVVNINKIEAIEAGSCTVGSETLPISASYDKALMSKINLLN